MFVPHQNPYVESLTTNVLVLGYGAFGGRGYFGLKKVMRVGPHDDFSVLKREEQRAYSPFH